MEQLTVKDLRIEEKLRLLCCKGSWYTADLGGKLPKVSVSDGPVGLRKEIRNEDGSWKETLPSVAYPSVQGLANTWSRACAREMGEALADDCIDHDVDILLAPGVNIKRNPLNGRNFEYFSEDPYLAGTLAYEYIVGLQGSGVGACLKHYYANNLEYNRYEQSSEVDDRTLREIYLKPFAIACKAKPVSGMCAYNRVNGVYASENKKGFRILREEFGFDGAMYSDWGAVRDRTAAAKAGLDIEFPFDQSNYDKLVADYKAGRISEEEVDACAARVLQMVYRCAAMREGRRVKRTREERHAVAQRIAEEGIVLLKNEGVLPLTKGQKVCVGGEVARPGRARQVAGGGSSMVEWSMPFYDLPALLAERLGTDVAYESAFWAQGIDSSFQKPHKLLEAAAVSDVAVVCVGGGELECEGTDRSSMRLPAVQEAMILETVKRNKNTVVVVFAGSAVDMSAWQDSVAAVVWAGFPGEGGGDALADILTGKVCPSGKLSESFPYCLEENPSYASYSDPFVARYQEGLDVGYRYYDTYDADVAFPFGHGLSYATFEYGGLRASAGKEGVELRFDLRNTSAVGGKEVVQVYVHAVGSFVYRPYKELKAYDKIEVPAGRSAEAAFALGSDAFAYWSTAADGWRVDDGLYEILIGASSRDIRLKTTVECRGGVFRVV